MPDGCEFLKISVISVPEKGKANQELITWLSKKLKLSKSDFSILSGEIDRFKKILIKNASADTLHRIQSLLP